MAPIAIKAAACASASGLVDALGSRELRCSTWRPIDGPGGIRRLRNSHFCNREASRFQQFNAAHRPPGSHRSDHSEAEHPIAERCQGPGLARTLLRIEKPRQERRMQGSLRRGQAAGRACRDAYRVTSRLESLATTQACADPIRACDSRVLRVVTRWSRRVIVPSRKIYAQQAPRGRNPSRRSAGTDGDETAELQACDAALGCSGR